MIYLTYAAVLLALFGCSSAPDTEVYIFDLDQKEAGWEVSNPVNISSNPGYDNQPSFSKDEKYIFYARTVAEETEIASYYVEKGDTEVISDTPNGSEYSPTPAPSGGISSIRLDDTGYQRLYLYDQAGNSEELIKDLVVGYHTWLNDSMIASYVLGEVSSLQVTNIKSLESNILAENIGRSLHAYPGSEDVTYIDQNMTPPSIVRQNIKTGKKSKLVETLEGSQDFCWGPGESIFMGKDDQLFVWKEGTEWQQIADLSEFGLSAITRLAFSPKTNKLAVVVTE